MLLRHLFAGLTLLVVGVAVGCCHTCQRSCAPTVAAYAPPCCTSGAMVADPTPVATYGAPTVAVPGPGCCNGR
jgi:hypothetical protein